MPKKDGTPTAQERREWEEGQRGKAIFREMGLTMVKFRIKEMTLDEVINLWFEAQKL